MSSKGKLLFTPSSQESPHHQSRSSAADINDASPLNSGKLKLLYSTMLQCRMLGDKLDRANSRRSSAKGLSNNGSEPILAGCALNLLPQDSLLVPHCPFSAGFLKGIPLARLFAAFRDRHLTHKRAFNQNGSAIPDMFAAFGIAAGIAATFRLQNRPSVSLVISPSLSSRQASWLQVLRFCGEYKLPVVFVVQSVSRSAPRRSTAVLNASQEALACGIPGITVDGTDAVALSRVCQEAVRRAREGHGPSLMDCRIPQTTLRSRGVLSPRPASGGPLFSMEDYLRQRNLWSDEWKVQLIAGFEVQWKEAVRSARHKASADSPLEWIYSPVAALNTD